MNRRDLLKHAPAALAAPVVGMASLADAKTETPVMGLFREWAKHRAYVDGSEGAALPDDQFNAELDHSHDLEVQMMNTPSQSPQDFIAKFLSWTGGGDFEAPSPIDYPGFWAEARALVSL